MQFSKITKKLDDFGSSTNVCFDAVIRYELGLPRGYIWIVEGGSLIIVYGGGWMWMKGGFPFHSEMNRLRRVLFAVFVAT